MIYEELPDNRGVHNFGWHILDCYFWLWKIEPKGLANFISEDILLLDGLPGTNRKKVFVYAQTPDEEKLKELQKECVIYSIEKLDLPKSKKFKELCYDLNDVFNPDSYANAKKRYKALVYPEKWMESNNITVKVLDESYFDEIKTVHDRWVQYKLDDPNTFKMMFPNKRYLNCVIRAFASSFKYRVFGVFDNEKLVGVRVVGIDRAKFCYDMAFFTLFWETKSQVSNFSNIAILRMLFNLGYETFNCGCFLNKKLHTFKAHYPHYEKISFAYSREKKDDQRPKDLFS